MDALERLPLDEQLAWICSIVAVCAVLAVVAGLVASLFSSRPEWRERELESLAVELGLQFSAQGSPALRVHLLRISRGMSALPEAPADRPGLQTVSRYPSMGGVMFGRRGARDVLAFDFAKVLSERHLGNALTAEAARAANGRPGSMSVLAMSGDWAAPHLVIRPERWDDRLAATLAIDDVDFDSHREFSDKFYVYSRDKAFARAVVTPQVMEHLLANPGWFIEVCGSDALIYDLSLWKPERFKDALAVLGAFLDRIPQFAKQEPGQAEEEQEDEGTVRPACS